MVSRASFRISIGLKRVRIYPGANSTLEMSGIPPLSLVDPFGQIHDLLLASVRREDKTSAAADFKSYQILAPKNSAVAVPKLLKLPQPATTKLQRMCLEV